MRIAELRDQLIAQSSCGCLTQEPVARAVVLMLRDHPTKLIPPWLQDAAVSLGMPRTYESGDTLARWLEDDGWIQKTARPWVGDGMGAVWAYEPTDKWRRLVSARQEV